MKIEFDVWRNSQGEIFLTSDDPRLPREVVIQARPNLASTESLRAALTTESRVNPRGATRSVVAGLKTLRKAVRR